MGVPAAYDTCAELAVVLGGTGVVESIARLDPDTGYIERCDTEGGVDFPIIPGEAYMVEVLADVHLEWPWSTACPNIELQAGMNFVAHPAPMPGLTCFAWLAAQDPGLVSTIQGFDSLTGRFESCLIEGAQPSGSDFPIRAGRGYLLHATGAGFARLPGCP